MGIMLMGTQFHFRNMNSCADARWRGLYSNVNALRLVVSSLSGNQLFCDPMDGIAQQVPLSTGFPRQYWNG